MKRLNLHNIVSSVQDMLMADRERGKLTTRRQLCSNYSDFCHPIVQAFHCQSEFAYLSSKFTVQGLSVVSFVCDGSYNAERHALDLEQLYESA